MRAGPSDRQAGPAREQRRDDGQVNASDAGLTLIGEVPQSHALSTANLQHTRSRTDRANVRQGPPRSPVDIQIPRLKVAPGDNTGVPRPLGQQPDIDHAEAAEKPPEVDQLIPQEPKIKPYG